MCLYPKLIRNKKYSATKKNNYQPGILTDERIKWIPVPCGRCMECMRQKANGWKIRLYEDIKKHKNGKFVTLTFSDESIKKLTQEIKNLDGYSRDNKIATIAVRRFLERHRKETKKSIRHFLVTELGHNGTENIHLHGILYTDKTKEQIEKIWKYGYIWMGYTKEKKNSLNERTINYITKYITKLDEKHKNYQPKVLCSKGIGDGYNATQKNRENNKLKDYYRTRKGNKVALPTYYRKKAFSDEEREKMWIESLEKNIQYVNGIKIDTSKNYEEYSRIIEKQQEINIRLGYGTDEKDWQQEEYERQQRNARLEERIRRASGGS